MGIIKEALNVIGVAFAQQQGFKAGLEGKPVAFQFTDAFPQETELAKAYHKAYANGQKAAVPQTLNSVNEVLNKVKEKL